ncbi:hypothetical protein J7355_09810 [Endozoicomonas sp. G2_2]|uniref:hypothetical protein n=1 Tax=Endozoicomonas sp. G2_2 TaxID=2821092 RepID=UPI001ADCEE43|nr:hypothetical protein [Endozoicomonas sp. G2_2]MBO9470393.1 hypothetical protein [Endozoicomonas sp. G2_2]
MPFEWASQHKPVSAALNALAIKTGFFCRVKRLIVLKRGIATCAIKPARPVFYAGSTAPQEV